MIATTENTNVGDRVSFKTVGGWYNSGIVKDVRKNSFLVEVDRSPTTSITLPYLAIVVCSKDLRLEKIHEMYWRSIKDEKPPVGERVILSMKAFGWRSHDYIYIGVYDGDKNVTHWMPRPEDPEKSPNYEIVDFDTAEIKEVDSNDEREWKKKGENEMTIGEFCDLIDPPEPGEYCPETLIFLDENCIPECQMKANSPFLKKFFWDKKFKSVTAEGTDQFGILGLED